MGYDQKEIEDSLKHSKYDDITATYLLLGRKQLNEVSVSLRSLVVQAPVISHSGIAALLPRVFPSRFTVLTPSLSL